MSAATPCLFYAAEVSYFSAKVRPALRYKAVPYVEKLPTRAAYREVIVPRTGLAFIPILITPEDETWQDTSEILDALEARVPHPPLYPRAPLLRVLSLLFELYADEFLVLPAMHYRWSFPESEAKARADFAAITGDPESAARFASRMHGSIVALGVSAASIPGIEAHLAERLHLAEPGLADAIATVCDAAGLPVRLPEGANPSEIVNATRTDKKSRAGVIEYALPRTLGEMAGSETGYGIPASDADVLRTLEQM